MTDDYSRAVGEGAPGPQSGSAASDLDLRLVIPAVAVWIVTLVALLTPTAVAVTVVGVAGMVCVVATVAAVSGRVGWSSVGLVIVVGGLAAGCGAAVLLRVDAVADHPVARAAGQKVTATIIVRDDPVALGDHGQVRVTVDVVGMGTTAVRAGRSDLIGDSSEWAQVVPGLRTVSLVRIRPPRGHDLTVARLTAVGSPTVIGGPPRHHRIAAAVRERLQLLSAQALGREAGGLLPGLVLGDVSTLDPVVEEQFRAAGLTHLVAV
ncbi:hypothetical protein GS4_02_00010, partial [Gordonia soli NBRC 108243]